MRQCAVYGVGVLAQLHSHAFAPHVPAALRAILAIITAPDARCALPCVSPWTPSLRPLWPPARPRPWCWGACTWCRLLRSKPLTEGGWTKNSFPEAQSMPYGLAGAMVPPWSRMASST